MILFPLLFQIFRVYLYDPSDSSTAVVAVNMFYVKIQILKEQPHLNSNSVRKTMRNPPVSCAALSPLHIRWEKFRSGTNLTP